MNKLIPRRAWWLGLMVLLASSACAAAPASGGFGFDSVTAKAQKLAAAAYQPPEQVPEWLRKISYDEWRDIRFKPSESLWRGQNLPFELQFFHAGLFYDRTVAVNVIDGGKIGPLEFSTDMFDYGANDFAGRIPEKLGFAGFRIHGPIKSKDYYDEIAVFLGASYFRAVGKPHVYGLSARGVAVDTAEPGGEEFPWFREFWLVKPKAGAKSLTLFALLDSPSLTGAYKFVITPGEETAMDVDSVLFPRKPIAKLGIAPLTSMFFYGENRSIRPVNDFRPEVHDSDGLLVAMDTGEWLWRPLRNPTRLAVNAFLANNPRGFGLLQRDLNYEHYLDLEARYDLRPSAWITPKGDWGDGNVELVQIPTANEMNDNIVAFWVPKAKVEPGKPMAFAYRLNWYTSDGRRPPLGRAAGTYTTSQNANGEHEKARRFVIEFSGSELEKLPADAAIDAVVDVGAGAKLVEQQLIKNGVTKAWRLVFQIQADGDGANPIKRALDSGAPPIELRAYLRSGDQVLSETWSYTVQQ